MSPRAKPTPKARDEASLLEEIRTRFDYASRQWEPIRQAGAEDMRYISGDTWDSADRDARKGRPCLSFDQLNQYLNQLQNSIRQQKRAIKVTPKGSGSNDQTAQFRASLYRQIEYDSHAQQAYIAAFTGAAQRSYGFCRLVAEYDAYSVDEQVLRIKAIPNPDQVLPDPDAESPTGQDWRYLFFLFPMSIPEFKRAYPYARVQDFSGDLRMQAPGWLQENRIIVAEYWCVDTVQRERLKVAMMDGSTKDVWADEISPDVLKAAKPERIIGRRMVDYPSVGSYTTNGFEILHKKDEPLRHDWPGPYIPFAACYGPTLYMPQGNGTNTSKVMLSYVRLARDGQKYYNWVKSTEAEVMSMTPKTPFVGYVGQFRTRATEWQTINQTPQAYIEADPVLDATGLTVLPLPERQPYEPAVQAYELAGEAARRDIQNALGRYSASVGRSDSNVKSGVAIEKLDRQSDQGSYHFIDAYDWMIEYIGCQLEELVPYYYDTARHVALREPNDQVKLAKINDPTDPESQQVGDETHAVTISTGANFDSERERVNDFAQSFITSPILGELAPPVRGKLIGSSIRLLDLGPLGDEMANTIDPPPDGDVDPKQLLAKMQEMEGQLQMAHQLVSKAQEELQSKQAEQEAKKQITLMQETAEAERNRRDNETKLAVAELGAKIERLGLFFEERSRVGMQAHESALSAQEHAQGIEAAAHQGAIQGDQMQQQAAMQPTEEA